MGEKKTTKMASIFSALGWKNSLMVLKMLSHTTESSKENANKINE